MRSRPELAAELLAKLRPVQPELLSRRSVLHSWWALAAGVVLVAGGTLALIGLTDQVPFDRALFEVTSAFATVGLSTGITPTLPPTAQVTLVILMYVGRVGTIAVGTAIALNTRRRLYRYPEERPLVG